MVIIINNNTSSCLLRTYLVSNTELSISVGEPQRRDPGPHGTDNGAEKTDLEQIITHN